MNDGIFVPQEAEVIKNIPLAQNVLVDYLFWPHSRDGNYTCKSSYRFLKEKSEGDLLDGALNTDTNLWKQIWSLNSPNKVKNLICIACRNSLPTKQNLVRQTIIHVPNCDWCSVHLETALHALWSSKELDIVWENSEFSNLRHWPNF